MDMGAATGVLSSIPLDWMTLGACALILALDSLRNGIGRSCAIALALPISVFLFSLVDKTIVLNGIAALTSSSSVQAATFGILFVVSYLIVRRMALEYIESGSGEPIQALLAGIAATIVIVVVWLHVPALSALWQLNDTIQTSFAESYRFAWLLGAYLALAFARG